MEKYSNTTVAGDPNGGSGLSNRCCCWHRIDQLLLLVVLGGPIGPVGRSCRSDRGCGIQWNFHRVVWKIIPIQPVPECLSASSATAVAVLEGPLPPQSIRIDLWALNGRSGCLYRSIRIPLVDEVSFKIKDTFQCTRDRSVSIANHLELDINI